MGLSVADQFELSNQQAAFKLSLFLISFLFLIVNGAFYEL